MNYRHIYHAGNFADIFKHLLTLMTLDYLQQKEKGLLALDAFAGLGLYDLQAEQAQKTQEYISGIENFMEGKFINPDLVSFQETIRPYWNDRQYPGSPLLIAERLRDQDRLIANELHPDDHSILEGHLSFYNQAKVTRKDAYEALRAHLPPPEKRGLILIDPPFEIKNEFEILAKQIHEWIKRFANGVYLIWYPIKADSQESLLFDAAYDLKINNCYNFELLLQDRKTPAALNGCGMLVLNTPFQIPERVKSLSEELTNLWPGSRINIDHLDA